MAGTETIITDEIVKKNVVDELYWDFRVDASKIKVEVADGIVALTGTVSNYSALTSASVAAWRINGVKDVTNLLTVTFPQSNDIPTDEDIKAAAKRMLEWDPDVYSIDIDVNVNGGLITLEGTVDAYWKRWKAEDLVSNLKSVVGVKNHLTVTPNNSFLDQDISKDIEAALERDKYVNAEKVIVKVEKGKVTLSGTTPSNFSRAAAYNDAAFTAGVTEVENDIVTV